MKALELVLPCVALSLFGPVASAQDTAAVTLDTGYVEYHESPFSLPLGIGLRIPSYDRVNGLSLRWGPKLETGNGRIDIDGIVAYRSNLGEWDPSLEGTLRPGDENEIDFYVGQGTLTNDEWIRNDLTNSLVAFFAGSDARNYYRARRGSVRFTRTLLGSSTNVTPFIGVNFEKDWSTGSLAPTKSPWSVFGRKGEKRMRRPNPPVAKRNITSVLGGSGLEFVQSGVDGKLSLTVEHGFDVDDATCPGVPAGLCPEPGASFTQGTIDGKVMIPTFGTQTLTVRSHAVVTGSSTIAPPQRFVYLGGSGTLGTVDLLALGGDNLLFFDADYVIPIERIQVPILGSAFLALRYAAGNAGIDEIPALIQNLGVGAGLSLVRVDLSIDPASNRSPFSRRSAVSVGINLSL